MFFSASDKNAPSSTYRNVNFLPVIKSIFGKPKPFEKAWISLADYTFGKLLGVQELAIRISGSKLNLLNELRLDEWQHKDGPESVTSGCKAIR